MTQDMLESDRETFSIVVLGALNPAIFQPLWFSANELMPREETETAEIRVITQQITSFSMGDMQVQVETHRLGLATAEAHQEPMLRDLAMGTLLILEHTPLDAIGLNMDMAFTFDSDELWQAFCNRIVPKQTWSAVLDQPEMKQVILFGKSPESAAADHMQIRIQTSSPRGVSVAINQHYQLKTDERSDVVDRHKEAIRVLSDDWSSFASCARKTARRILVFDDSTEQSEDKT